MYHTRSCMAMQESELAVQEPTVLPNVSWYKTHSNRCPKGNMTWEELPENVRNMVSQRIVVNDHYKLMYCPTPMVSVGPFMRLMYAIEWNIPVAQVSSKHIGKRENFAYLSDYSIQEQTDMIDTYRKFIVTRHPFMRLLAVYKQKFMASNAYFHERYGKEIVRKFRGDTGKVSKGNDVTFEEFVKYIGYYFPQNEHWMMQYSLCLPCHVQYDISLHYETVKEESLKLLNHFHLESVVDAVPIDAWDYIDSQEAQAMFDTIPVQIMGKLVQNYEKDFELFDYSSLSFTSV